MTDDHNLLNESLTVGSFELASRLIAGTGKYADASVMRDALAESGCSAVTVAVRRERLYNDRGESLLDALDLDRYTVLPNTAGCFNAEDAVRVARLGRDLLEQLGNPGSKWVKLEVLGDTRTLLPDPVGTLEATRELVADGFEVLCYTSDDPISAARIKEAGAVSVMPAGSPIGSGQGVVNRGNIAFCIEMLKQGDPRYPVIVDAGVGSASDAAVAMELGADGVLMNTAIALAREPVRMARAMRLAIEAGHESARAGRIPMKRYASASSPMEGVISALPEPGIIPGE
ncbi:MAG: thiazole synthase [Planctomycetota bacterium]